MLNYFAPKSRFNQDVRSPKTRARVNRVLTATNRKHPGLLHPRSFGRRH